MTHTEYSGVLDSFSMAQGLLYFFLKRERFMKNMISFKKALILSTLAVACMQSSAFADCTRLDSSDPNVRFTGLNGVSTQGVSGHFHTTLVYFYWDKESIFKSGKNISGQLTISKEPASKKNPEGLVSGNIEIGPLVMQLLEAQRSEKGSKEPLCVNSVEVTAAEKDGKLFGNALLHFSDGSKYPLVFTVYDDENKKVSDESSKTSDKIVKTVDSVSVKAVPAQHDSAVNKAK